ncbi:MAG: TetR/AcrR family transcriptional regulator [Rhodospirillales bacterium]
MVAPSKRSDIVEAGLDLVHSSGFAGSGVAAITAAGGAPKGSFYNHFKSKQDYGVVILDRYFEAVRATLNQILEAPDLPALERVRRYFAALRDLGEEDGYARGCLIGNLSAEMAANDPVLRERLEALLGEWTAALGAALVDAQRAGELRLDPSADVLAGLLLDAWQGALLRAKVERSAASLDAFLEVLLPALLAQEQS